MASNLVQYIEKAEDKLRRAGISLNASSGNFAIAKLVGMIPKEYDEKSVLFIAKVLSQQEFFNSVVRHEISSEGISSRYLIMMDIFNSIKKDTQVIHERFEDGNNSLKDKISASWMIFRRGSIASRFEKIKKIYTEVVLDTSKQIEKERLLLDGYHDYRIALKQAEVIAFGLLESAEIKVNNCKIVLDDINKMIGESKDLSQSALSELQLKRDEALRQYQDTDSHYQLIKDLSENITISYHSSEGVFSRLAQSLSVKERVYRQSVSFFSTNEILFTAISSSLTSLGQLSESTRTLNSLKDGINDSIELLAKMGNKQLEESLRAGYGPTVRADSIKKLVDAIVDFQESSTKLIEELRTESTNNAKEIERITNEGKERFAKLITGE